MLADTQVQNVFLTLLGNQDFRIFLCEHGFMKRMELEIGTVGLGVEHITALVQSQGQGVCGSIHVVMSAHTNRSS